jgi:hypothetical protein
MANSTWGALTNECLRYALLPTIAGAGQGGNTPFNDDTQLLEFQFAAKYYVRLAHKLLTLRAVRHFAKRRIALNIQAGQEVYPLDTGIGPQGIQYGSFWNVTPGGSNNQQLQALPYEQFLAMYPDPTNIEVGPPVYWVLLPIERAQMDPTPQNVQIVPIPDQNYNLQYRAQVLPYALNLDTDTVLWPPEFEHALTLWSWNRLESTMGEGKEAGLLQLAQQAVDEVHLIAGLPDELRKSVRTMNPPNSLYPWPPGRYTGWVSSPLG